MNVIQDKIQQEALLRWELAGRKGLLAMGTGTGKSRIALLRMEQLYTQYGKDTRILLAVPRENLRDENWPADAKAWGVETIYDETVEGICYASLAKRPTGHYHLVILDEYHNLTPTSAKFLDNVTYDELMGLTATEPEEDEKTDIQERIAPTVFTYSLADGVKDGVASDFCINVIEIPLDSTQKYVASGSKKKRFYVTEYERYKYLSSTIVKLLMSDKPNKDLLVKMAMIRRTQFINSLKSKTEMVKILMKKLLPDKRTLIYAGSILQANELGGSQVYHSQSDSSALDSFKAEKSSYLVAVDALNEGQNIPNVDQEIIAKINSKERKLVQQIGRAVRFRPGHVAQIYIVVVAGTVDEKHLEKATKHIDPSKITYLSYKNFL